MLQRPISEHVLSRIKSLSAGGEISMRNVPRTATNQHRNAKRAAVLIPFCNRNKIPSLIFTLRTETVGTHKGQVSFPGGHLEPSEDSYVAAIRETKEELGDNIGRISVLGKFEVVPAISGTLVTPVLGFVHDDLLELNYLKISPKEVAKVFTISLEQLVDPQFKSVHEMQWKGKVHKFPVYGNENKDERVWGLTAIILEAVIAEVIRPVFLL